MLKGLYKDWIISGFNEVPFTSPKNLEDEWFIEWTPVSYMPKSYREECVKTAKIMGEVADQPIKILMSGGKDSEATCRSFMEAGVPFECAIVRHERDSNLYDIAWGVIFCETNNVPYKIYDINVCDYYSNDETHKKYSYWDRTTNYSSWLWVTDQIGGLIVGSNGCIYEHIYKLFPGVELEKYSCDNNSSIGDYVFPTHLVEMTGSTNIKTKWWYGITEQMGFCWDNYYTANDRESTGSFHCWRPEQLLSQLIDPFTKRLINNEFEGISFGNELKSEFYQSHWPEITSRPKYTGNEKIFEFKEYQDFRKRHKDTILQELDIRQRRLFVDDLVDILMKDLK